MDQISEEIKKVVQAGIGAVAVDYFCVWLLRDRLRDQYVFTIRKKQ